MHTRGRWRASGTIWKNTELTKGQQQLRADQYDLLLKSCDLGAILNDDKQTIGFLATQCISVPFDFNDPQNP